MRRRSIGPRPALSLAHQAAQRTALEAHRVRPLLGEIAAEHLAFLGAVHLSRPFVGAVGLHVEYDRNADDRPATLAGIGVVLVGLGLAGFRIVRLAQPDDVAAQRTAAVADLDARLAALGEPRADRIGRGDSAEAEHGKRNGGGAQHGHGRAPHLARLWSEPILPASRQPDNRRRTTEDCGVSPAVLRSSAVASYTATAARAHMCPRTRLATPT